MSPTEPPGSRPPKGINVPEGSVPEARAGRARRRASVFPISLPRIPDSVFPIRSQEELVAKLSRLFLASGRMPFQAMIEPRPPLGYEPPTGEGAGSTEPRKSKKRPPKGK